MDRRWPARALVLGLHLGLLAVLWGSIARPPMPPSRLTSIRLIPLAPPVPAPRQARPMAPRATARPAQAPAPPAQPAAPMASPDPGPAPAPQAEAEESPRAVLRLNLPAGAASAPRNPALSDPRANSHRPSFEDKLADAMGGDGRWAEEDMGNGRTLLRRGDTCVNLYQSRIANIDPFNESVKPTLRTVGKPYKCR